MTIIYPYLFVLSPEIYLLSSSKSYAEFFPFFLLAIFNFIIVFIAMKLCKEMEIDPHKSAFILSCLLLWLFLYEPTRLAFHQINNSELYKNIYFIFIWLGILAIFIGCLLLFKIKFEKTTYFMTLLGTFLIIIQIINFSLHKIVWRQEKSNGIIQIKTTNYNFNKESLRDIYYIVLDTYPGFKPLKDILNFNNNEFMNYLKDKGFYVPANAHPNYCNTKFAMSCYLNMQYHPVANNNLGDVVTIKNGIPFVELIEKNQIAGYLKSIGYSYKAIIDYYVETDLYVMNWYNTNNITVYLKNYILNMLKLTLLRKPVITNYIEANEKRNLIPQQINMLHEIIKESEPKFVYIHLQLPHSPYIFDEKGKNVPLLKMILQKEQDVKLYLQQLMFTNNLIKGFIHTILTESQKPPLIIIQGDHGPRDFGNNEENKRRLTLSILNAYYFPDGGDQCLYDSITPVNTFRIILNYYFKQNLPLLKDEFYYSYYNSPTLINMTNQLR